MSTDFLKLYTALFEFQSLIPEIEKNCTAKAQTFSYKYADLPDIKRAIKPALEKCNLLVTHSTIFQDHIELLVTKVIHIQSGEYLQSITPIPSNLEPQKKGAWFTYFRRYHICNLLDIAADEDVDGIHKENVTITKGVTNERYNGANKTTNHASASSNGTMQKPGLYEYEKAQIAPSNSIGTRGPQASSSPIEFNKVASYVVRVGKHKNSTLSQLTEDQIERTKNYYLPEVLDKTKPARSEVKELVEMATIYLETKKINDQFKATVK